MPAPPPKATSITLNEGRELSPGDTPRSISLGPNRGYRSTKAGSLAPATLQRLAHQRGDCARSTKAGSLAPATLDRHRRLRKKGETLNEGRELSPGDTSFISLAQYEQSPLNEGRELSPGDTSSARARHHSSASAQRRPGA